MGFHRNRSRSGFVLVERRPEPPAEVWARLWDLDRHTAAVPLTVVRADADRSLALGSRFVARTALGAVGVDDVMVVRAWDAPRRAVVEKVGRVLRGRIEVELQPDGSGTRVTWTQEFRVVGVPALLTAPTAPAVALGYRRALRAILG